MKPLVAGNWKMHKTRAEAAEFARKIIRELPAPLEGVDVAIFPPYTAIAPVAEIVAGSDVTVGAQNLHPSEEGAFTGEISAPLLLDVGATRVLVGHTERRHGLAEGDAVLNAKLHAALRHDMLPVLCVGETLEERDRSMTPEVVKRQVQEGLRGIPAARAEDLSVAYEPVWAIGTGRNATPDQVTEVHTRIRQLLIAQWGEAGRKVRILYGGSVKPDNARELLRTAEVNGALVGGASLHAGYFAAIVRAALA